MPIPNPDPDESQDEFIQRCVEILINEGTENEQAIAICMNQWEENNSDMIEGHIFIQGIISPWQDKAAEDWGEVNIKQVTQQIQDCANAEKLIVHIHSPGGDVDEGFGIHDILVSSGKEIETRIEGLCASIATVIALAGKTRLMTENSEFMIHNPWGWGEGDADELQKYADQVKAMEDKIIDFYVAKTGADRNAISDMMDNESWLSAEKAKELGFITDIITTIKAVAKFNPKNTIIMNKKELESSIETMFDKLVKKIKDILPGARNIQALTVTTADGTVLDFGEQVETADEITEGMTATIQGGGVPDGDYAMPDGATWTFENGTLTAMNAAEPSGDDDEQMKALKAENETLKQQLEDANAKIATLETSINDFNNSLAEIKAQIKSDLSTFDPDSLETGKGGNGEESRVSGLKPKLGI